MYVCEVLLELVCVCCFEVTEYLLLTETHAADTVLLFPSVLLLENRAVGFGLRLQNIPHQVTPWQHAQPHPLANQHFNPPSYSHLERDTHTHTEKGVVRDEVNQRRLEE